MKRKKMKKIRVEFFFTLREIFFEFLGRFCLLLLECSSWSKRLRSSKFCLFSLKFSQKWRWTIYLWEFSLSVCFRPQFATSSITFRWRFCSRECCNMTFLQRFVTQKRLRAVCLRSWSEAISARILRRSGLWPELCGIRFCDKNRWKLVTADLRGRDFSFAHGSSPSVWRF